MKSTIICWWKRIGTKVNSWLIIILLISLGLRIGVLIVKGVPSNDNKRLQIAENLVNGQGFTHCNNYFPFCGPDNNQTAMVGPVPVLIFAPFLAIFGNDLGTSLIIILQMLLGLVSTMALYKIIIYLFDNQQTALLGAFLWGTYIPMITMGLYLEAETIFTCFLIVGILVLLHGLSDTGRHSLLLGLVGFCFGLAAMSRESFLYFPLILAVILLLIPYLRIRRRIINSGILIAVFTLTLLPWIARNALVFNAFIPASTMTGYNLYRHNHIIAEDNYLRIVVGGEENFAVAKLIEERVDLRGNENEFEMDRVYQQEAIQIIRNHPLRYLLLSFYRALPLWTDLGLNQGQMSTLWQLIAFENIVLLMLAATTTIRRRGIRPPTVLLVLALIIYNSLGYMMVVTRMRFTMPIMSLVIILAADQCMHWSTCFMPKWRHYRRLLNAKIEPSVRK